MIDPLVRPAEAADVDQLCLLEREARTTLVDQRGGPRWLETHAERADGWAAWLDATHVAYIDEVVVGYIVFVGGDPMIAIDDVYVTPGARELGFGDALLAAAIESGRALGATLLEAEALPGDRETKNLYERAGIKARLITVSAPI